VKAIDAVVEYRPEDYYRLPKLQVEHDVNFLYSEDLETIESGARGLGRSVEVMGLILGMAIVRIERDGLWIQAGYKTLQEYRKAQNSRLGVARSTVSLYRRIAEAWLEHKRLLSRISLDGRVSKLLYLPAALELHQDDRLVLEHFKSDTWEDFKNFARPDLAPALDQDLIDVSCTWNNEGISINGELALLWPTHFPETGRQWLGPIVARSFQAKAGGNIAHVVEVYDDGEARAVDNFIKKLRASK
jgi:hypothetical protein